MRHCILNAENTLFINTSCLLKNGANHILSINQDGKYVTLVQLFSCWPVIYHSKVQLTLNSNTSCHKIY